MTLDRFRLLHLRRFWQHRFRTTVSVVGIAAGVALVVAMASLLTSVTATAEATVALLGGARYEVTAPAADLDRIAASVEEVDGVDAVRRYVEAPVMIDDQQAWLVALGGGEDGLTTPEGRDLAGITGIRTGSAMPASGAHLFIGLSSGPSEAEISGRVPDSLAARYGGRFVAADLQQAETLRGDIGTGTLLVYGEPSEAALAAAAGDGVGIGDTGDRISQARNSIEVLFASLSILGVMGLVVGGFLLFNTMNMAVLDRRQELASLRALGSNRRSILVGVMAEAVVLGGVGSFLGLLAGTAMARGVIAAVPDAFSRAIGIPLQTSVPITLLAGTWVLGVATAVVAAIGPAKRAVRIEPLEALRPDSAASTERQIAIRPILLLVGLALSLIGAFADSDLLPGSLSLGVAMAGLLCLAAGAGSLINRAAVGVARRLGANGELAATSLLRSPRRVWGATTVVMLAVAIAVTTTGLVLNFRSTTYRNASVMLNSDFWVGTTTGDTIALITLPAAWTAELEAVPGVQSVAASTWIPAESGPHIVGIQGVYGDSSYPFARLADDEARRQMAAGDGAIVIKQTAITFDYEVGDVIDIPGATPPLRLPIVAITDANAPTSGGMINISHQLMAEHFGIDGFARYEVQLEPDADRAGVRAGIEDIISPAAPTVGISTGAQFLEEFQRSTDQTLALVAMVLLVIVTCAAIAVLNTLLASVLERTGELAVLRAIGATRRRILTSVAYEALAIGVTGAILGVVAGCCYHAILVRRIRELTAFAVDYAFSPLTVAIAIITGVGIAAAGAAIPCRRVARMDLLDALAQ